MLRKLEELELNTDDSSYVRNEKTQALHDPLVFCIEVPASEWVTRCGWRFAGCRYTKQSELPPAARWRTVCEKCMPLDRAALREEAFFVEGSDVESEA